MTRGEFLSDAPSGAGRIISGYGQEVILFEETIELSDGSFAPLHCGRRVTPHGWGSKKDEESKISREEDSTFIDKQTFPLEWKLDPEQSLVCRIVISKPVCHYGAPAAAVQEARLVCATHKAA